MIAARLGIWRGPTVVDGNDLLRTTTTKLGIDLKALIAACAVWSHPDVFHTLCRINPHGVWYPNQRRLKNGEKRRKVVDGVILDDNTSANNAIKLATFGTRDGVKNFHACHIWPGTCYNPYYHTCIANLVLIPAALAGLSDYDEGITACLRYRSWKLYQWKPIESDIPQRPDGYPSDPLWLPPLQPTEKTLKSLRYLAKKPS